jgi:hypothetical protein
MKIKAIKILGMILLLSMTIPAVYARGPSGNAGKSNVAHLYLVEKDPNNWSIVEDGAWGKLKYNMEGPTFDFVFNGHGLELGKDYSLIYYADLWGANPQGLFIGEGSSDIVTGDIHIAATRDLGTDLPMSHDDNLEEGAKIWLVLSSHITVNTEGEISFTSWDASEYLFEYAKITYEDTDTP